MAAQSGFVRAFPLTPARVALAALLLIAAWMAFQGAFVYGGQWRGLFHASAEFPLPGALREDLPVHPAGRGYDGQLYRVIARDPWPPFQLDASLDAPSVRRQRILVPALAWLLAAGQGPWIDAAFVLVVWFSAGAGVFWTARWFAVCGRAPAWGLLFLITPSAVASVDRMLVDATLLACFAAAAVLWQQRRWAWLAVVLALASLTRETGILIAAGAATGLLLQREWKPAAAAALAALPALLWMAYLTMVFGPAVTAAHKRFLLPGLWHALTTPEAGAPLPLHLLNAVGLLMLPVCLVLTARWAWTREPLALLAMPFLAVALMLGAADILGNPYAYGRALGPVFALVLWTGAAQRSWWTAAAALPVCAGPAAYSAAALLRGLGWGA
jgi:hypothetical protein